LVNIQRKQIKVFWNSDLFKECGNILFIDDGYTRHQATILEVSTCVYGPKESVACVKPKALPPLGQKECGVAFSSVSHSNFGKYAIGSVDSSKNLVDNTILTIL